MDLKGLNKDCDCGSKKLAGYCCKKNEACPCGSGKNASVCCFKQEAMKKESPKK